MAQEEVVRKERSQYLIKADVDGNERIVISGTHVITPKGISDYILGSGQMGGTTDYRKLFNKPSINGIELVGNIEDSVLLSDSKGYGLRVKNLEKNILLKQDRLTAGENISIVNNVISATGGGATPVTPDRMIDIGFLQIGESYEDYYELITYEFSWMKTAVEYQRMLESMSVDTMSLFRFRFVDQDGGVAYFVMPSEYYLDSESLMTWAWCYVPTLNRYFGIGLDWENNEIYMASKVPNWQYNNVHDTLAENL